jgi:hypothetical protein
VSVSLRRLLGGGVGPTAGNYVYGFTNFQFLGGDLKRVDMNAGETGSSETVYFEPARFFERFGFRVSAISANINASAHSAVHKDIFVAFSLWCGCDSNAAARRGSAPKPHARLLNASLTHRHLVAAVLALVEPHRAERERQPAEIVGKADHQNDPAGNRSDRGAIDKFHQG